MTSSRSDICYDCAHIFLNPHKYFFEEGWKKEFEKGKLNTKQGFLELKVQEDYVLQMCGITVPLFRRGNLLSKEAIIDSVKRLLGDFGDDLNRYKELAQKGIVQDDLYFTPNRFFDYSKGDQVTKEIQKAKDYSANPEEYFPKEIKLPEGLSIEFVPTLKAMREIDVSVKEEKHYCNFIGYKTTFAEAVHNFLKMYDLVSAHREWERQEENKIILNRIRNHQHTSHKIIPIAKLVLPVNKEDK